MNSYSNLSYREVDVEESHPLNGRINLYYKDIPLCLVTNREAIEEFKKIIPKKEEN